MNAVVDQDICTGCGLCVSVCPEVFEFDADKAKAREKKLPVDLEESAKQAESDCPVGAIQVSE